MTTESDISDALHTLIERFYRDAGLDYDADRTRIPGVSNMAARIAGDIEDRLHELRPVLREAVHHGGWLWPSGHDAIIPSDLFGYIAYADGDEVNPVGTFSSEGAAVKAIGARL